MLSEHVKQRSRQLKTITSYEKCGSPLRKCYCKTVHIPTSLLCFFLLFFTSKNLREGLRSGPIAGGPAYYVLHPQKGITICLFFLTYQAFKNREGIISRKILTEGLQI